MAAYLATLCLLVAVTMSAFAQLPESVKKEIPKAHATCVKKEGIDENKYESALKHYAPPNPALKCMYKCILQELGMMSDEGKVTLKGGFMDQETLQSCIDSIPITEDLCELGYLAKVCVYNHMQAKKQVPPLATLPKAQS